MKKHKGKIFFKVKCSKISGYKEETLLTNKKKRRVHLWEHAWRKRGKDPLLTLQWLHRLSKKSKYQVAEALHGSIKKL